MHKALVFELLLGSFLSLFPVFILSKANDLPAEAPNLIDMIVLIFTSSLPKKKSKVC